MSNALEQTDDIEGDLRAAFEADQPAATQATEPVQQATTETTDEGPVRDEHGRFAPKVDKPAETPQSATQAPQEAEKPILPPASWSATAKADFATLPPHIQQEVLRREKEMNDGLAQFQPKSERLNKLDAVLAPIADRLTLNGLTPETYIAALVRADEMLRGPNAGQALQMLAQQYGINPQALQGQQQQAFAPQQYVDPTVQALQQQLQALTQQVQSREQAEAEAQQGQLKTEIETFAADPAHMYFDNVKSDMAVLLRAGKAKDLSAAYDMACHMDPTIRNLIAKPVQAPAKGQPNGKNITGSPGAAKASTQAEPTTSIEDDVRAAYAQVSGRV